MMALLGRLCAHSDDVAPALLGTIKQIKQTQPVLNMLSEGSARHTQASVLPTDPDAVRIDLDPRGVVDPEACAFNHEFSPLVPFSFSKDERQLRSGDLVGKAAPRPVAGRHKSNMGQLEGFPTAALCEAA